MPLCVFECQNLGRRCIKVGKWSRTIWGLSKHLFSLLGAIGEFNGLCMPEVSILEFEGLREKFELISEFLGWGGLGIDPLG